MQTEFNFRRTDPDTSRKAAASMRYYAKVQRRAILELLSDNVPRHHRAIDEALQWDHHTAGRRLPELRAAGLVEKCGTAPMSSGRHGTLYRITAKGREALR